MTRLVWSTSEQLARSIQNFVRFHISISAVDLLNWQGLCRESGIWTVGENSHVLLELLYFGLENVDLGPLRLGVLEHLLESFVQNFILVSLGLDCGLERLVIVSEFLVQLILHNLCFFNEYIHHDVDFLPNLVGLFFKQLQRVVTRDKLVLQKKVKSETD